MSTRDVLSALFARDAAPDPQAAAVLGAVTAVGSRLFGDAWTFDRHPLSTLRVRRLLGTGGTSVVYEAFDITRARAVAIKVLRRQEALGSGCLAREYALASRLRHPNIVRYYDFKADPELPYAVMQRVPGGNLLQFVWRDRSPAALDLSRLLATLSQVSSTLAWLHAREVAHCDVKPSNILVTPSGRAVLIDFGCAVGPANSELDRIALAIQGTPAYMAAEQFGPARPTPACDWYALGGTIFHAFVGRPPFANELSPRSTRSRTAPAPSDFVSGVPSELDRLCCDLLCIAPEERPSGNEVITRLNFCARSASCARVDVP